MYLSAQRVRAPRGATGVNVALYLHSGTEINPAVWGLPAHTTLATITSGNPGKLATSRVQIKPGGNSVESFVDVVAPDGTSATEIGNALEELRQQATAARNPAVVRVGHVTAEFSMSLGEVRVANVFDELAGPALMLYSHPEPPTWVAAQPLTIDVQNDDEGWVFGLDLASAGRVTRAGGRPARVRVRYDVADDFRRVYGHLYPHAAQWVTNLSGEALLELGGAKFVHDGTVVGEWPARG